MELERLIQVLSLPGLVCWRVKPQSVPNIVLARLTGSFKGAEVCIYTSKEV